MQSARRTGLRALDKVQAKSKECAKLQSEVHQLEEEAETLREGEKERERLLQTKNRVRARAQAHIRSRIEVMRVLVRL